MTATKERAVGLRLEPAHEREVIGRGAAEQVTVQFDRIAVQTERVTFLLVPRTAVEVEGRTVGMVGHGLTFAFINLSGGIGIPYKPDDKAPDIFQIGENVRKVYEQRFPENGPAIKTELGRWVTGPEGWLVSHATHHKDTYKHYIGLDACAANLMRPAMYGAYHHITVCGKSQLPCDHVYDVTGCLCENNDKFAIDRQLPEICDGDLVVIHDTGAHGYSMGYNYNGRLRSAEILYTQNHEFRLIRRAEEPKDYFATLDIDPCAGELGI